MFSDRDSTLLVFLMISGGATQLFGLPSFLPVWLNDALSTMFMFLMIASFSLFVISQFHQNTRNNQSVIVCGLNVGPWFTIIVKHIFPILFVVAVLSFTTGAWLSPAEIKIALQQTPDHKAIVKATKPIEIDKDVGTSQVKVERVPRALPKNNIRIPVTPTPTPHRVFTPRTPKELMDIAEKKTRRDAMKHGGTWIHVEGPVFDISEPAMAYFAITKGSYIRVEVAIESPPHYLIPRKVNLYVKTNLWKKQVDKIERGDWLVATGIVHQVYKMNVDVIDGEIISVSGSDSRKK